MAMKKGVKIGLSVLTLAITGTLVYMMIKKRNKKKLLSEAGGNLTPQDKQQIISNPVNTTDNPPTSTVVSTGNTPFTNRTEGNAFRGWINDTYPTYAAEIDLDRTGQYNNSYIKKAWEAYGSAYQTARANALQGIITQLPTSNLLDGGQLMAERLHKSMDGFQTNENEFWDITNNLSVSEREQVKTYFDANLGEGSNLCNWIEGDFSFTSEERALAAWGYPNDAGYLSSNCNPPTPWHLQ
jgi:hypothetical protein